MVSITLDERDKAVLQRLREGDADVESIAESVPANEAHLRNRLPELADNGLVERTDGDRYAVTSNGERVVEASPAGAMDERIDTSADVEREITSFDLSADEEEAVRKAFSFLRYWGEASDGELIDAIYSEIPAAFESRDRWWSDLVRDRLERLPSVEPPSDDDLWRYGETPIVEQPTDDGRFVTEGASESSAKFVLERLEGSEAERAAVRAAFDHLVREGQTTADEIRERVYPDHPAGYESPSEWWDGRVRDALASLPGVERNESEDEWEYHQIESGAASSEPGAEMPDDPSDPASENDR